MGLFDFLKSDSDIIKDAKAEARILINYYKKLPSKGFMNAGVDSFIEKPLFKVLNNKKNHSAIEKYVEEKNSSPKGWALMYICNLVFRAVSTGENHIYGGALDNISGASVLPSVFTDAQNKLVELGEYSKEEIDSNIEHLKQTIKSVG